MTVMSTLSWIGVMALVGMILRAKIPFLANILMPASVIGGVIGFILMNVGVLPKLGCDFMMCNQIVGFFFTLSFISIGLTGVPQEEESDGKKGGTAKEVLKGSLGLGLIWCMLYGLTPLLGYFVMKLVGAPFGMDGAYGLLIPFAFCQGPGQSAAFGMQIEAGGGLPDATQVAITFSVIGFFLAFIVGVPIAKIGMKKGLARHPEKISPSVAKGIYPPEEQTESCGNITTYNGNIDTLAFHIGLVGLVYLLAIFVQKLILMIPVTFIAALGGMTFFVGLFVAYLVKWLMVKLNIKQYHSDVLQARITGFTTDFLIIGAFMAVQMTVIGKWLVPILVFCLVIGAVTLLVTLYFAPRIGGKCDFERTLGLWGCATGTCPSGVALIRVADPNLKTTAAAEMGAMNAFMVFSGLIPPLVIEFTLGHATLPVVLLACLATFVACTIALKLTGCWKKPTFGFKGSPVVCPDVTDDCDEFEKSETHSPF